MICRDTGYDMAAEALVREMEADELSKSDEGYFALQQLYDEFGLTWLLAAVLQVIAEGEEAEDAARAAAAVRES